MQRDRNNEVRMGICRETVYPFQGKERKRVTQVGVPVIFEGVDQIAYGTIIEKVRPCSIKMRWLDTALTAVVVVAGSGKRDSAECTERRYYKRQAVVA